VKVVTVGLDDGTTGLAVVEMDEHGNGQATLLTPPPEQTDQREQVRKVEEPIALTPTETRRSFRLWPEHLARRRHGSALVARALGQLYRARRRFDVRRRRPPAGRVKTRARARAAPRRTGSRSRDRPRQPDDDDVSDGRPRCPRCGAAAHPVPGSALWTCDDCAEAIWEQMVEHELTRVLAEADRITREAA
jgi:hypothetical protein